MNLNAGLLGGGSWGTTVAALIAKNTPVTMWARDQATVDEINTQHSNAKYLPNAVLPSAVRATTDIEEAVAMMDVIVMGIPSQSFRGVLEQITGRPPFDITSFCASSRLVTPATA